MPNISKDRITVKVADKNLILIGKDKSKNQAKLGRAIRFKENINPHKVEAFYKDRNLMVTLPKEGEVIERAGKKIKTKK